jgi:hypothetical protein
MNLELLVRDSTFQLNILLWMAKEQPREGYRVRPVFYEYGFKTIYIQQPFPLPEEVSRSARESGLSLSLAPEPELILGRDRNGKALYFEAKADSFSPDSTKNSRQARGHLLATGPAFSEVLAPLTSSLLCYVVPDDRRILMFDALTALVVELRLTGLNPGSFSCHGLGIAGHELIYSWDSTFKGYVGEGRDSVSIMTDLEAETDPSPIVLVFSEEDCPNINIRDFYRRVVLDQIRARLLCDLQGLSINLDYEVTADQLLLKASDGIFQYLGRQRQKRLRLLVRKNFFKRMRDYWNQRQRHISVDGNILRIRWESSDEKDAFLTWLEDRRVRFDTTRPQQSGMPLLDNLLEPNAEED